MSRSANNMTGGLGGLTKSLELRQRILFVVFALIVFRLGSFITLPGIDPSVMKFLFEQQRGSILDMFNMFSGGSLSRMSVFALGVMPYISASIIIQMMTHVYAPLVQLRKEGERGRKKGGRGGSVRLQRVGGGGRLMSAKAEEQGTAHSAFNIRRRVSKRNIVYNYKLV